MILKRAVFINAASKYAVIIMNICFTAVLARLLTPDDYGIIAILNVFTTFFSYISNMGFGTAVIQFQDLQKYDVDNIFSFTGYMAFALAVLFTLLGYPISAFYANKVYISLCILLSVSVFFNCLDMIPNAILFRDKNFLTVAVRTIVVNIVGYVLAIVFALWGWKYYALAIQSVTAAILNYIWNNHTAHLKWNFHIDIVSIKRIWKYSFFQFAFNWVNYFEGNLDSIFIGGFMGGRQLAYYDKGYKMTGYPLTSIAGIITPVLHPILKDYQNNKKYLYDKYMKVQAMLSIIAFPISSILFCSGREIIMIFYGNQWGSTVLTFQILCLSIYPRMMMSTTGSIYCSAGNTKMLFIAGFINMMVTCSGIILGICFGSIETVATGVAISSWSNMIVTFCILIRQVLNESVINYFGRISYDIIAMLAVCIVVYWIGSNIEISNAILSMFVKSCIVLVIYIGYLVISGKYSLLKNLLQQNQK